MSETRWNVQIRVEGALMPVESVDFLNRESAERYAAIRKEEIKRQGSTHRVSVTPMDLWPRREP